VARTTAAAVKGLIDVDDENIPDITPFIDAANELVTEVCVPAGYTDGRLELIERYLAAHFYAVRDPAASPSSETAGPVGATYRWNVGLFLQGTKEGQQALTLDTAGGLARLSKQLENGTRRRTVSATWLGTTPNPCGG
jgi:hypothetical protein